MMKNFIKKIKKLFSDLLGKKKEEFEPDASCYREIIEERDGKLVHIKSIGLSDYIILKDSGCKNWDEYKKKQEEEEKRWSKNPTESKYSSLLIEDSEFDEVPKHYLYEDNRNKFIEDVCSLKENWACKTWLPSFPPTDIHFFVDIESLRNYLSSVDNKRTVFA